MNNASGKTLWEKEKMLVTIIFSFSHNIFRRFFSRGPESLELCGKELSLYLVHAWLIVKHGIGKLEVRGSSFTGSNCCGSVHLEDFLTVYHTIPTFIEHGKEALRKHSGKRKKMLASSTFSFSHNIFSFSHNVFYPNPDRNFSII